MKKASIICFPIMAMFLLQRELANIFKPRKLPALKFRSDINKFKYQILIFPKHLVELTWEYCGKEGSILTVEEVLCNKKMGRIENKKPNRVPRLLFKIFLTKGEGVWKPMISFGDPINLRDTSAIIFETCAKVIEMLNDRQYEDYAFHVLYPEQIKNDLVRGVESEISFLKEKYNRKLKGHDEFVSGLREFFTKIKQPRIDKTIKEQGWGTAVL